MRVRRSRLAQHAADDAGSNLNIAIYSTHVDDLRILRPAYTPPSSVFVDPMSDIANELSKLRHQANANRAALQALIVADGIGVEEWLSMAKEMERRAAEYDSEIIRLSAAIEAGAK